MQATHAVILHWEKAFLTLTFSVRGETSIWRDGIERHRHKARLQADAMAEVFGRELHVNSDDVMWGLGQVSSHYDVLVC
jgi:hypothetical protein